MFLSAPAGYRQLGYKALSCTGTDTPQVKYYSYPRISARSMSFSTYTLGLFAVSFTAIALVRRHYRWMSRLQGSTLPPGPRGWPLIGSLLEFPAEYPWVVFREWSRTYGDMMFLRLLNTQMLIVSTANVAVDLMEKRSAIYSDKPVFPMDELTGWDFDLALMPYGQRWRSIRAHFHQYFNSVATPNYHDIQTTQIHTFLRRSLDCAGKQHDPTSIRLMLAATILDIVYGLEIQSMDDEYLDIIAKASDSFAEGKALGRFWVDFIPWLKYLPPWIPGAASAKFGAQSRPIVEEMVERPFRDIQSGVNQKPSMARKLFEKLQQEPDLQRRESQLQHIKDSTGLAYIVGSDTTYCMIQTFFCAMAMSPDILKRAQKELETVVGPERLPTFEDSKDLPYIRAIILECLRWLPVTPLGMIHRLTTDDYYNGYFIPKGTVVVPNIWQMLRNPKDYPEPDKFNPNRFLKGGILNREIRDPSTLVFGFGRRICPGRHFSQDNAFLTIATVLHVFDIVPSLDENGNKLDPTPQMTTGILSFPDRFNYMLLPRSEAAERLVRETDKA
ncbi:cytochrome P450 [Irpex rosettiformis]|uniref:Cytochrome P450 n=1 Tax=Irpex rosettiformis TaxID=378272 RepID=A0ACB8UE41_9APHY|nr:cytochrome P450 [Irpex rosettiformis]